VNIGHCVWSCGVYCRCSQMWVARATLWPSLVALRLRHMVELWRSRHVHLAAMCRTGCIFMVTWSLLAMPCLCIAGVLHHPCNHGEATECDHEDNCPIDPCASQIVAPAIGQVSKNLQQIVKGSALVTVGLDAMSTDGSRGTGIGAIFKSVHERTDRTRLPVPPSDLPLLI
jgi:hypothetical protein